MHAFTFHLAILISILLFSCHSHPKTNVQIINESNFIVSNIHLHTASYSVPNDTITLNSGDSISYVILMPESPKTDGDYILKYETQQTSQSKRFGYYTNGGALFNYTITILKDTVIIDEEVAPYF